MVAKRIVKYVRLKSQQSGSENLGDRADAENLFGTHRTLRLPISVALRKQLPGWIMTGVIQRYRYPRGLIGTKILPDQFDDWTFLYCPNRFLRPGSGTKPQITRRSQGKACR